MSCRRSISSRHGEEPRETIPQFFANALSKKKPAELTVRFGLPAQPVDATQALNLSAGVSNCKVSRGRSLS